MLNKRLELSNSQSYLSKFQWFYTHLFINDKLFTIPIMALSFNGLTNFL
jgi:hypothetical protein